MDRESDYGPNLIWKVILVIDSLVKSESKRLRADHPVESLAREYVSMNVEED